MNPIIPKTNATFGSGAPSTLLLGEIATNRTAGELYLGTDTGVDLIAQKVTSIARGGTGSTSAAAALNALGAAPIASPAFTGTPTVPTAAAGTNTLQAASTAFVQSNKGDKYKTTSTTTWTISKMVASFTVDAGLSYTATQDVTIAFDANNHAHGSVVSYSGTTLIVDVKTITGSGTYSAWTINIGGFSEAAGALLAVNNLSDVANPATALSNLGGVSNTAVIPLSQGGTGSTTAQAALNQLVGGTTENYIVGGDGANVVLRTLTNNDLPLSGAAAGTFGASNAVPVLTVNSRGVITALTTAQIPASLTFGTTPGAALTTAALAGISPNPARADHTHAIPITDLSGDVVGTGQGSVLTALSTTGVFAGAYGGSASIPVLTIDAKGRVTAASTAALPAGIGLTTQPAAALQTAALAGIASEAARADHAHVIPTTTLTGDVLGSGVGSVTVALATTGVSAGSFGSTAAIPVLTIDAKGRLTAASSVAALTLTTATPAALGTAAVGTATTAARADHVHQTPTTTLTGDATGSGNGSIAVTLATSGVAANTYGSTAAIPVLTVDAKGRITAASTAALQAIPNPASTVPLVAAGTGSIGTLGTFARADHVHPTQAGAATPIAATGAGSVGTSTLFAREDHVHPLATTGVSSGIWGSSAAVPVLDIDSFGRITAVSTQSIPSLTAGYTVDVLVVAGGGGGGRQAGGGGGGGGLRTQTLTVPSGQSFSMVIGAGGPGQIVSQAPSVGTGGNSSAFTVVALGGGGGAGYNDNTTSKNGAAGGSGGGAWSTNTGGSNTLNQGFAGGIGSANANYSETSGGGGGAGAAGANGGSTGQKSGDGGVGVSWYNGTFYSGGGGGGNPSGTTGAAGVGGNGGGGNGGTNVSPNGISGTSNTGGGGGGGGYTGSFGTIGTAGNGGSGVVVVRYPGSQRGTGGTVTSSGGYTFHTFTTSATFTA